jgi:predicted enzyme related to lactoylglutathione lyase
MMVATGLPRLLRVDRPLDVRITEDIEEAHRRLVAAGATPMLQIGGELLAERDGIPLAGIKDVPGGRVAVLRDTDGELLGLWQEMAGSSSSRTASDLSR